MKDNSRHSVLKSFLAAIMVLIMAFSMTTFVFADEEEELGDDETGNTSATESEDGEEEESPYVPAETGEPLKTAAVRLVRFPLLGFTGKGAMSTIMPSMKAMM